MTLRKTKVIKLILDKSIYPRHEINGQNLADMKKALQAGVTLPPIVADEKTHRIVDGVHRFRAHIEVFGPDAETEIDFRSYKTEAEMLWDAVHLNAGHGQRLTHFDQARSLTILRDVGYGPDEIAKALNMSKRELEKLEARKIAIGPDAKPTPIKRSMRHLAGDIITELQLEGSKRATGLDQLYLVNRLIDLFEYDLLDRNNAELLARLAVLAEKVRGLGAVAVA